jgi:hypothetical protein
MINKTNQKPMKEITIVAILFTCFFSFSQSKDFLLIDTLTSKPINLVQISYPNLQMGSVSNADGNIRIPLKKDSILVSHINYLEKIIPFKDFSEKDTLFLVPKTNQLKEIVLYNLDLKEKFSNILQNTYLKNYSTKKAVNKSTYKETFRINDSLNRLFQVQLNWGSKDYLFSGDKPIEKKNKIVIESVDYSKLNKVEKKFINANGAYIANENLFRFIHLNFLLTIFKNLTSDYKVNAIEKEKNITRVYFDATLFENGKKFYEHKNSLIVFDEKYNSITYLKLNMIYESEFEKGISKLHKTPYQKKTTKHNIELSFNRLKNNKLKLHYFISNLEGVIKTEKFTNNISSKQSLFVSESILGEKIKKSNIDFNQPFYKNLPENLESNDVKILLTKEEREFLKK